MKLRLALLAFAAVLVHGYHLGVDDAAIYIPAIKHAADPSLYPFGSEFFMAHGGLTLLPVLLGIVTRWTHLPVNLVIFGFHYVSVFLLLLASWKLLRTCFASERACWGGVALLAGALSVPAAGTALVIMDPYVTARSLSTPAAVFAIGCYLANRRIQAVCWLVLAALAHPQMSGYCAVFLGCAWLAENRRKASDAVPAPAAALAVLPVWFEFERASGPAREALLSRTYFFMSQWAWYEWVGAVAPLAICLWWAAKPPRSATPAFDRLIRTIAPFGLLFTAAFVVLNSSPRLENFTRLQPMRAFHLIYVLFFLILGAAIAEYLLRGKAWRWAALFAPLAAGMLLLQQHQFPNSPHVEWPGYASANQWTAAFDWVRVNTSKDAVFALDPDYMLLPGDDQHGFRAVAERSALADATKDSGVVSLFPRLAGEWKRQVGSQEGWDRFTREDFERLTLEFPVTWIVARTPPPAGLRCPYQNREVAVCRIEMQTTLHPIVRAQP